MLEAYSDNQTVNANDIIPFNSVVLQKGVSATLGGVSSIQLNKCGVYEISFVASGLPSTAGAVNIQMTKDGVAQPQASVSLVEALTTVSVVVPITTLVQVTHNNGNCCCASPTVIQFVNTGVGLTDVDVDVVVTKIC